MDYIRPIQRDVDAIRRVEALKDEPERRERESGKREAEADKKSQPDPVPEGPVEGDDGHFHIDIKA